MPRLGQINKLNVIEKAADGVYLDGAEFDDIFLPRNEVPDGTEEGQTLEVFLYLDVGGQIVATTQKPLALLGECAKLKVLSVGKFGAFLDWGIGKDLLLPHSEQAYPVEEGKSYVVYVFQDERTDRIAATTKLHFHLDESSGPYKTGDQVDLLIAAKTDIGYKAVINGAYLGLIYGADLSQPLQFGERRKGWIKSVRDDGKVDLTINALDAETRDELEQAVLNKLGKAGGHLELSDKSAPEEIYRVFKVSKKNFKRAISALYKKRLIIIEPDVIRFADGEGVDQTTSQAKAQRRPRSESRGESNNRRDNQRSQQRNNQPNKKPGSGGSSKARSADRNTQGFKASLAKTRKSDRQESGDKGAEHSEPANPNAHIYQKRKPS